ncbi:unnamed protein product [Ectocarpus sp. 12 AP-2014]
MEDRGSGEETRSRVGRTETYAFEERQLGDRGFICPANDGCELHEDGRSIPESIVGPITIAGRSITSAKAHHDTT